MTAMFFFEEPPPGYAVLWSVSVGAAVVPVVTRRGRRFIASFGVVDSAQTATDCLGDVGPVGTMPCKLDNSHFKWIRSDRTGKLKSFGTCFFNSIGSTCHLFPSPQCINALLVISVFDQPYDTSSRSQKKTNVLNRFVSSLTRAPTAIPGNYGMIRYHRRSEHNAWRNISKHKDEGGQVVCA